MYYTEVANKEMEKAAKEEATLARECGDVDKEGIPLVTVVADCMWGKRSYRNKYNSLSGTVSKITHFIPFVDIVIHFCHKSQSGVFLSQAAIVKYRTKNVLHIVRNKYCAVCDRRHSKPNIPPHKCYKN